MPTHHRRSGSRCTEAPTVQFGSDIPQRWCDSCSKGTQREIQGFEQEIWPATTSEEYNSRAEARYPQPMGTELGPEGVSRVWVVNPSNAPTSHGNLASRGASLSIGVVVRMPLLAVSTKSAVLGSNWMIESYSHSTRGTALRLDDCVVAARCSMRLQAGRKTPRRRHPRTIMRSPI